MSDVVRPSFEANPHDLKSREGARGVQALDLWLVEQHPGRFLLVTGSSWSEKGEATREARGAQQGRFVFLILDSPKRALFEKYFGQSKSQRGNKDVV